MCPIPILPPPPTFEQIFLIEELVGFAQVLAEKFAVSRNFPAGSHSDSLGELYPKPFPAEAAREI